MRRWLPRLGLVGWAGTRQWTDDNFDGLALIVEWGPWICEIALGRTLR